VVGVGVVDVSDGDANDEEGGKSVVSTGWPQ